MRANNASTCRFRRPPASGPAGRHHRPAHRLEITIRPRLPNGLKLYTVLDKSTPNVTVQVWYGVGAKDDPAGRLGLTTCSSTHK